MAEGRTSPRFPDVPLEAGHYESFYIKACRPGGGLGVWVRYTVLKKPGRPPTGSLWVTLFDAEGGPLATKVTTTDLGSGPDHLIRIGESRFEPGRATGSAGDDASWDITFATDEDPYLYLPRNWMYSARIPRTKALSPYPAARFGGELRLGTRTVDLDGFIGMIGHNWGSEHAERWIWLHGAGFEGRDGAWIDAAIGRVRLGPWTLPWIGNGRLHLDGRDHQLGGIERARTTRINESPVRCDFELPGPDLTVRGRVEAPPERFVGWVYASPDEHEHHTVNCSISDLELTVVRRGEPDLVLNCPGGAAYELGMRETDHGMAIQPFPDE